MLWKSQYWASYSPELDVKFLLTTWSAVNVELKTCFVRGRDVRYTHGAENTLSRKVMGFFANSPVPFARVQRFCQVKHYMRCAFR